VVDSGFQRVLLHVRKLAGAEGVGHLSDQELLERFLTSRDETAFTALVERHGPMVLGVCRRVLRKEEDAEDACQATFLVLARTAATIRKRASLGSWLHGTAHRLSLKMREGDRRRRAREARTSSVSPATPDSEASWREVQAVLDEELGRLPEKFRQPLVLCYLEGEGRDDAAAKLRLSPSTLRGRLEQGRGLLRARLARRGVTLSASLLVPVLAAEGVAMPVPLVVTTVRSAVRFAAGASVLSTRAAALAEEGSRAMLIMKGKAGVSLLLALVVLAAGATFAALGPAKATREESPAKSVTQVSAKPEAADEHKPAADRYGDPLPRGALKRLGTTRFRPGDRVNGAAFSPDGKTLALASDWVLGLWDVATGREVRRLADHTASFESVAFAPDGKTVAAACYAGVRLWEVSTGRELRQYRGIEGAVWGLAFSPDGKTLTARSDDNKGKYVILLWDVTTGEPLRRLTGHDDAIQSIAFSPNGEMLASSGNDRTVRLWQVATGRELHRLQGAKLEGSAGWIWSVAFSPDGKLLASVHGDETIHDWDPRTGKQVRQFEARQCSSAAFSADGKILVTGGWDGSVRLWEVATGKEMRKMVGRGEPNACWVALSPDGKRVVSWDSTNTVRLWDTATGKELRPFDGHLAQVVKLHLSTDGRQLTSWGREGAIRLWDVATGNSRTVVAFARWLTEDAGVAFSWDGKLLAIGSYDKTIRVWETATGKELHRLTGHDRPVLAVAFAPDGRTLVSWADDGTIRFWDLATAKEQRRLTAQGKEPCFLAFSPDGRVVACADKSSTVYFREVATGKELRRLEMQTSPVDYRPAILLFSPDGKLLATARSTDPAIRLWDVASGAQVRRLEQPPLRPRSDFRGLFSLSFSPDGQVLASSWAGGTVHLWEVRTGKEVKTLEGHRGEARSLVFSPDGKVLFSGSDDSTILSWNLAAPSQGKGAAVSPLTQRELRALWDDLASDDATRAWQARWALVAGEKAALPFLKKEVRPVPPVDRRRIARLVTDLDKGQFVVREKATKELEGLGESAEPTLREALSERPSLETRRRIQGLLEKLAAPSGGRLRLLRALEVLEHMSSDKARAVLKTLATGAPGARLTEEARAAVGRFSRRTGRVR
jgi:RNA polymerase sigma factor (sigma-70 family)